MKRFARLAEPIALRFARFEPMRAAERTNPTLAASLSLLFELLQQQPAAVRAFSPHEFLPRVKRLGTSAAVQRFLRGYHLRFLQRGRHRRSHARKAYADRKSPQKTVQKSSEHRFIHQRFGAQRLKLIGLQVEKLATAHQPRE